MWQYDRGSSSQSRDERGGVPTGGFEQPGSRSERAGSLEALLVSAFKVRRIGEAFEGLAAVTARGLLLRRHGLCGGGPPGSSVGVRHATPPLGRTAGQVRVRALPTEV